MPLSQVPEAMKSFVLRSPAGEIVRGWNLTKFARDNSLDATCLVKVVNGEVRQHRGWTHPNKTREDFINRVRGSVTLTSPDGSTFEVEDLKDFCALHKLNYKLMLAVVNGRKAFYKGWMLYRKEAPW